MLGSKDAMATIAVRDIAAARRFYGETLGLEEVGSRGRDVALYCSGKSRIVVYRSEFAGTNKATSATWDVGAELETIVQQLKAAGVVFEHYDIPGLTLRGDIHESGGFKAVWFKDPDGNILHINSA